MMPVIRKKEMQGRKNDETLSITSQFGIFSLEEINRRQCFTIRKANSTDIEPVQTDRQIRQEGELD